jgi:hypothetical protein
MLITSVYHNDATLLAPPFLFCIKYMNQNGGDITKDQVLMQFTLAMAS